MDPNHQEENQTTGTPPAQVPPAQAPEQTVPYTRLQEEINKRQELELQMSMLREQQLRTMAQQQYVPPVPQEPEDGGADFDQEFSASPKRALDKYYAQREKALKVEGENIARRIYLVESNKAFAAQKYPDLKNPNSDFFKRVAFYMQVHPEKYQDPEGILDACARVAQDMPVTNPTAQQVSQQVVQRVATAASQVAGSNNAPAPEVLELDPQAQALAVNLGIDPKKYAERLKNLQDEKGEYAPAPGKTGKAQIKL